MLSKQEIQVSGAWELRANNSVLAYTMHTDNTTIAWAFGLKSLIIPGQIIGLSGMPFDHARNQAAMTCLQNGFEWLFSLDSDVLAPPDAVLRLMAHRLPIVSGLYHRRSPPEGVPVAIRNGTWALDVSNAKGLVEVDYVGAGCLLIHRSVIEKFIQQPQRPGHFMFDWKVNYQGIVQPGECLSEDFTMCKAAKDRFGIRTVVDATIRCKHLGYAEYDQNSVKPLNVHGVQC